MNNKGNSILFGLLKHNRNRRTVERFNSSTIQQTNGSTVERFNSSTVQQFNSSTVQQFNGSIVQLMNRLSSFLIIIGMVTGITLFISSPALASATTITNTCTSTYQLADMQKVNSGLDTAQVVVQGESPTSWISKIISRITSSNTEVIFYFSCSDSVTSYYLVRTRPGVAQDTFGPIAYGATYTDTTLIGNVIYHYAVFALLNANTCPMSETTAFGVVLNGVLFDPSDTTPVNLSCSQDTRVSIYIPDPKASFASETQMLELGISQSLKEQLTIPSWAKEGLASTYEIYCRTFANKTSIKDFSAPVYITLAYNIKNNFIEGTSVPASQAANRLSVFWWNGSSWSRISSIVNSNSQTLTCGVSHFSLLSISDIKVQLAPGFPGHGAQPNPFSPNGDNINDVAYFKFPNDNNEEGTFHIFDLNGAIVYTKSITQGRTWMTWDGYYNYERADLARAGIYIWQAKVGTNVYNGVVILAR